MRCARAYTSIANGLFAAPRLATKPFTTDQALGWNAILIARKQWTTVKWSRIKYQNRHRCRKINRFEVKEREHTSELNIHLDHEPGIWQRSWTMISKT
jgi:hypothetical protein